MSGERSSVRVVVSSRETIETDDNKSISDKENNSLVRSKSDTVAFSESVAKTVSVFFNHTWMKGV